MTAGWVAATMRGRALVHGALGVPGARAIAASASWDDARTLLGRSVAGRNLPSDANPARAREAAAAGVIWQLRVLAGWVPPVSSGLVRVAAGPIEIANIEGHVAILSGGERRRRPVALGSLATAWPRVAAAASVDGVRDVLRRSVWGDPGGTDPTTLAVGLRVAWLRRVRFVVPDEGPWVDGALAVLVARERLAFERALPPGVARDVDRTLGRRWRTARSVAELFDDLSPSARWPLGGIERTADLWRAERAVLQRVGGEAGARVAGRGGDRRTVAAVLALLLLDLWRIDVAIDLAGRGAAGEEAFDAVAA